MTATIENIFDEVQRISEKMDRLPGLIEINGNQVRIVSLDELSETLGLIMAGEFRSGNLKVPGDSFSGVRMGYPPFQYPDTSTASSDAYHLVGVDQDTLMIGISATDGRLYFGAGAGWLDNIGLQLTVAGDSSITPMIQWLEAGDTIRAAITAFEIVNDSDAMSLEIIAGGIGNTPDSNAPMFQQIVLDVIAHADSSISTEAFTFKNNFLLKAGDTVGGDCDGTIQICDWNYIYYPDDTTVVLTGRDIFSVLMPGNSTGRGVFVFNPGQELLDVDFLSDAGAPGGIHNLYLLAESRSAIFGGTDTSNLNLGILGEKALTFASTATAGIEDPDGEMGKLWLDTDAELRLTDTAGEDWFVTKSTSTGGGGVIVPFARWWSDGVLDGPPTDIGFQAVPGSDTASLMQTGEFLFTAGDYLEAHAGWRAQISETTDVHAGALVILDTAGSTTLSPDLEFGLLDFSGDDIRQWGTVFLDSGILTPGTTYRLRAYDWWNSTATVSRNYISGGGTTRRHLVLKRIVGSNHTVTT